jgi:hypothetical protein
VTPAQESSWSSTDTRNLIISFVGGFAANIGLVFAVGGAIAIDHIINKSRFNRHNLAYEYFALMGASALITVVLFLIWYRVRRRGRPESKFPTLLKVYIWSYLAIVATSMLIFLGVAAGVGK